MPLSEEQILSIETSIRALADTGNPLVPSLRSLFPDITFVRCDARDMDAPPFRTSGKYQIYLMDRRDVCIKLTDRLDSADGIIVAEVA